MQAQTKLALTIILLSFLTACGPKEPWYGVNEMISRDCFSVTKAIDQTGFKSSSSDGPNEFAEAMLNATRRPSTVIIAKDGLTATVTYHNAPGSPYPDPVYFMVQGEARCKEMMERRKNG